MNAKPIIKAVVIAGLLLALLLTISTLVANRLTAAVIGNIPASPVAVTADAVFEDVVFAGHRNIRLSGWYAAPAAARGAVLLLHGVRANRSAMLARARWLYEQGYAVLLYDSRAHGRSAGKAISFGYLEAFDAERAMHFLRQKLALERNYHQPNLPIGIIGMSMGGAAALLGNAAEQADWLVLEAVYPNLEVALQNRLNMRLGVFAPLAQWLLRPQLYWRFDKKLSWFSPLDRLAGLSTPVLVVAGSDDQHTTLAQSRQLAAAKPGIQLYIVAGAGHEDYYRYAGEQYSRRLLAFIQQQRILE